jgi:predicted RNA binding protein YcfA (HicA-like mRNA interferase family)
VRSGGGVPSFVRDGEVGIITTMTSKDVIKRLEREGWYLARVKGSHHQFKHPNKPGRVTVKHPDSDIPVGTLRSIERQAGWR